MLYKDLLFFGLFILILIIIVFSIYYIKKRFDYYDNKILDLSNALFSLIKEQTEQNIINPPYYENIEDVKHETEIKQNKLTTDSQPETITEENKKDKEFIDSNIDLPVDSNTDKTDEKTESKDNIIIPAASVVSVVSCNNQETEIKKSDDSPVIDCQEDKQDNRETQETQQEDNKNIFSSFLNDVLINDDKQETQKEVKVYIYNDKTDDSNTETENKTFTITPENQEIINSEHSSIKETENNKESDLLTKLINQEKKETIEKFKKVLNNDIKTIKLSDLKNMVKALNIALNKPVNRYKKDELYEVCSVYLNTKH